MLKMVEVIMWLAPIGVFALMAKVILASGLSILGTLAGYGLAVMIALAIHFFVVYSLTVKLFSRLRVIDFWRGLRDVFITAFSTSSSAATLPVNMRSCQRRLNIPPTITSFVLPLGCTVNMDGTAVYQGVAAVFIAQVYGIDLTAGQQLSIILTATLASIGTAPVPGAGMVMLAVIMTPLGIPTEGLALIFGIDRFLDMCRTILNVTGDAACSVMVASTEGEDVRYIPEEAPAPAS
jgi:Na+/H+-dicarboxylate symporter